MTNATDKGKKTMGAIAIHPKEQERNQIIVIGIDQKDLEVKKNICRKVGKTGIEEAADILSVRNHECIKGIYHDYTTTFQTVL